MVSPKKVKGKGVRWVQTLTNPLRPRFLYEARGTVTEGAGISTGITTNARGNQLPKILLPLVGRHGFHFAHVHVAIHVLLLFHQISHQLVINDGIPMSTNRAIFLEKCIPIQSDFKIATYNAYLLILFLYAQRVFFFEFGQDTVTIQHPVTGSPQDIELISMDLVFQSMNHHISGITTLGYSGYTTRSSH
jgi:hypothetical protein